MKQVGRYGLWVPEATDPPDGPTQINQLVAGTEANKGLNELLDRGGVTGGRSWVATLQNRTTASYGVLGTPDQVVLPAMGVPGFLEIFAMFEMKKNGGLNGVKAKVVVTPSSAEPTFTLTGIVETESASFVPFVTRDSGLQSSATGEAAGKLIVPAAAAGPAYTVKIEYSVTEGAKIEVQNRLLIARYVVVS